VVLKLLAAVHRQCLPPVSLRALAPP
jgi:hypothetical protein